MGWRVKSEAETMFGKDTFWVRKDMVNDLIGYRAAGVSDAWTGITRWSPEMQRTFKEFATVFFGTKAYRYLSTAEGAVEDVMSAVKTTIIVRSIVVMRDNLTANLLQLHMNGMSLPEIGKKMISKFLEITEYVKNKNTITTLERQYTSAIAKQNQTEAKKLRAKIAALEDANASMSIAPLIKAGEFNTISESLTEADVAIRDSKFGEWLETAVDKLPSGIGGYAPSIKHRKRIEKAFSWAKTVGGRPYTAASNGCSPASS
jgi:hypothetical protein